MRLFHCDNKLFILSLLLLMLLLPGCIYDRHLKDNDALLPALSPAPSTPAAKIPEVPAAAAVNAAASGDNYRELASYRNPDLRRRQDNGRQLPFSKTRKVNVSLDAMPLPDFITHIFADIFKVNYVLDNRILQQKEPVTINLKEPVSEYRLFQLASDLLGRNHISVYEKEGIFYLWTNAENQEVAIGIGIRPEDIPPGSGTVRQFMPIRYADAQNINRFLVKEQGLQVVVALGENLLVATGNREQIEQLAAMVRILDQPAMRGRYIAMMKVEYWTPKQMAEKLKQILRQEGIPVSDNPGRGGLYLNQLDRRGSLLAFAAEKSWLERARYWVQNLDVPPKEDSRRYFVYFPENSKAADLAEALNSIISTGISSQPAGIPAAKAGGKAGAGRKEPQTALTYSAGKIRIAVDENRNALLFYTTAPEYQQLKKLLRQLDIIPVQVLLEASIVEITLTDNLQFGLEWYLQNNSNAQISIVKTLGGLGVAAGGLDYSLISDSGKFKLLINAMAQDGKVKILSNPRLMVRDGKSASFVVGTEVPVTTQEATSPDIQTEGTTGIIRSVQYRSTGVSLQVTPLVHARGVVTMEISQEVSEAQTNNTSDISSPMILNRTINTEVVAADGQTVLLAGLISESNSRTVTKVPLLGDLPWVGNLFKNTSSGIKRTELVVMITPHIIHKSRQADDLREAVFDTFQLLERGAR
ncbi:MAG: type II secretion system protein GspD [Desulfobacca sp. 4484_104]|nr:MAG: type II secretion system protein GspD [Desulfobacca sp. 4484_104]